MIENQMTVNFDKVWDPSITKDPVVNENGQSDRLFVKAISLPFAISKGIHPVAMAAK